MKLSSALAALAADPHAPTDLARVALLIARDAYSQMNPRTYLRILDRLANQLRPRLTGSLAARTAELTTFLFEECGFAGNTEHYYDPRNSYLNKVIDRQVGLPIALSVLAAAVGTRAGLNVVGVGLPGHFIAKAVEGDEAVLFDPFNGGQFLDLDACEALVGGVTGRPFEATPDALEAAAPGAVVARMLQNLKTAYLADRSYRRAARVTYRLAQLIPHDPSQRRDLGVLLVQAGRPRPRHRPPPALPERGPERRRRPRGAEVPRESTHRSVALELKANGAASARRGGNSPFGERHGGSFSLNKCRSTAGPRRADAAPFASPR